MLSPNHSQSNILFLSSRLFPICSRLLLNCATLADDLKRTVLGPDEVPGRLRDRFRDGFEGAIESSISNAPKEQRCRHDVDVKNKSREEQPRGHGAAFQRFSRMHTYRIQHFTDC